MGMFKNLFTWWEGASLGTALFTSRHGKKAGSDHLGNAYFKGKDGRRWVIYEGSNDASRVPPEWFSWLHHQIEGVPDEALPPKRAFEKPATANLTGTASAYAPPGALGRGDRRAAATGDYQAWTPE